MENRLEHLAIIMDGNGRWAKQRGLKRVKGHEKGAEVVRDITTYCAKNSEIKTLTLYAFSTENWKRPKLEVEFLMKLLDRYLKNELEIYQKENVKFETIGNLEPFSQKLKDRIKKTKEATKNNSALTQIIALNYGAQDELLRAINRVCKNSTTITKDALEEALDTPYKNIDLLIRTSGEQRVSNFLLWQIAYAEFAFTNTLWPDFTPKELNDIIAEYKNRERRFGAI